MGKQYIESLERELNDNKKLSSLKNNLDKYKTMKLKPLLTSLGYEKKEVAAYVDGSQQYIDEHDELVLSPESREKYIQAIQKDVSNSLISKNKEVIFLLGLPGSGKSSSLNKISERYDNHKFYLIDADVFKEGKKNGEETVIPPLSDPDNKGLDMQYVHEASSSLAKLTIDFLSEYDYNFALPKIGDEFKSLKSAIENLKELGYKVYIHFLYTTVETALKRNLQRFLNALEKGETPRLVPAKFIFNIGYRPLYNFFLVIKRLECDDFALWDGENCSFGSPILLLEKQKNEKDNKKD